jgi:hypothetical protein
MKTNFTMSLFGKDKDSEETKQTQDIKEAASSPPQQEMPKSPPAGAPAQPAQSKQEFVNPFSEENKTDVTTPSTQPAQSKEMPHLSTKTPPASMPAMQTRTRDNDQKVKDLVEETVEKIMDEKWEKVIENVQAVIEWKESQTNQLNQVKEDILSIKDKVEQVEKNLFNKITEYDKDIVDVSSELRALEKVLNQITPTLVNNITELGKITQELKNIAPKKSEEEKKDENKK